MAVESCKTTLSGWSLRTREGAAHRGARRQSLHFSVLKVLGRAAIDTRLPADLVGNGAVRYPSGDLGSRDRDSWGRGRGL